MGSLDAQRKILIVDDELLIRWALSETFSQAGYRVLEASDARAASRTESLVNHPAVQLVQSEIVTHRCSVALLRAV